MSRIGVEIAKSVSALSISSFPLHRADPSAQVAEAPKARSKARDLPQAGSGALKQQKLPPAAGDTENNNNKLKRKLDVKTAESSEEPPNKKLQEFLNAMASGGKSNTWSNADPATGLVPVAEADDEDDEYVDLAPLPKVSQPPPAPLAPRLEAIAPALDPKEAADADANVDSGAHQPSKEAMGPVSDADWIRSKTSRLLDLVDDASTFLALRDPPGSTLHAAQPIEQEEEEEVLDTEMTGAETLSSQQYQQSEAEIAVETISQSGRLFVRNLPYSATEDELRQHFSACGELQEVNHISFSVHLLFDRFANWLPPLFRDEKLLIGTSDACLHVDVDSLFESKIVDFLIPTNQFLSFSS